MSSLKKLISPSAPTVAALPLPAAPKPVRMPNATDPSVLAAAQRTRAAALKRQGRLSTILTDQTRSVTGYSGQKLGA